MPRMTQHDGAHRGRCRSHLLLSVIAPSWMALTMFGFVRLTDYQMHPGKQLQAPGRIDGSLTAVARLYVFVLPQCPCSEATLSELERIQARTATKLAITIFEEYPVGHESDWLATPLVRRAKANAGWQTVPDPGGLEAKRFGASTSGFVILWDPAGNKAFQGGITPSRGHEGDNAGSDAIETFVLSGRSILKSTPVYGCSLGELGK